MHKNCIEFIVDNCRKHCKAWSECIQDAKGFDINDEKTMNSLSFCLDSIINPQEE